MSITIHVTELDLLIGTKSSAGLCPVALALAAAHIPGVDPGSIQVGLSIISYRQGNLVRSRRQPPAVHDFVYAFDHGEPVEPFSFEWKERVNEAIS